MDELAGRFVFGKHHEELQMHGAEGADVAVDERGGGVHRVVMQARAVLRAEIGDQPRGWAAGRFGVATRNRGIVDAHGAVGIAADEYAFLVDPEGGAATLAAEHHQARTAIEFARPRIDGLGNRGSRWLQASFGPVDQHLDRAPSDRIVGMTLSRQVPRALEQLARDAERIGVSRLAVVSGSDREGEQAQARAENRRA